MNRKITAFTAFLLTFALFLAIFSRFAEVPATALAYCDENANVKTIYLTFDDGPSDRVTPVILDTLKEEGVKATFFIIGRQAETRRKIVEREKAEGHTVAVHSYTHSYKEIYSSPQSLIADIDACNRVIKDITGEASSVYRFPGGSYGLSASLISAVCAHGMRYVDWNASMRDAEIWEPTPEQLYSAAICTSSDMNNIVMLAHDSTTKTTTAQALKSVIQHFKEKGYTFNAF